MESFVNILMKSKTIHLNRFGLDATIPVVEEPANGLKKHAPGFIYDLRKTSAVRF